MDKNEMLRYLEVGNTRSICVYRELSQKYPGFVIDIVISKEAMLKIEYNTYGYDEGGLELRFNYMNYDTLICALEEYIERPIGCWKNISRSDWYPKMSQQVDFFESGNKLKHDLIKKKFDLPKGWMTCEVPEGYWKDLIDGVISI